MPAENSILKIFDQIGQIKVKSITGNIFRYALFLYGFGTITAIFKVEKWVVIILFSIGTLILLFGFFFYAYFAKKNPDFLRSETFQLRKKSLELIGDKNNFNNPNMDKVPIISTSPYDLEENKNENIKLG